MPNTTFTKALITSILGAFLTGTAMAQTVPDGCFVREYDAAHLAAHPNQMVERLMLHFYPNPNADTGHVWVDITASMASNGRAIDEGLAGLRLTEIGINFLEPLQFGVECDGGRFDVARYDGDSLLIETRGVRVALEGCGGETTQVATLAEVPGETTAYLLYRADPAICEAN